MTQGATTTPQDGGKTGTAAIWIALISALASVVIAWITARGTAAGTAKTTIRESGTEISTLTTKTADLRQQINAASSRLPSTLPQGAIIAWYDKDGTVPAGWAICNGTQNTPDLRGRFLRGTGDQADAGTVGGSSTHAHRFSVQLPEDPRKGSDKNWGDTPWRDGPNPARGGASIPASAEGDNTPPYFTIVYIMKTKVQ